MDFFNQYAILPSPGHLELLRFLFVVVFLIHTPYVGIVAGSTTISVVLRLLDRDNQNKKFARLATDVMQMAIPNRMAAVVCGVLPLIAMWMIFGQWFYQSTLNIMPLFIIGSVVVALSFPVLFAYRETASEEGNSSAINLLLGAAGLGLLLVGYFIVVGSLVRFNDPERWHLAHGAVRNLTSFNVIWKFLFFSISGIGFTGVGMLFFLFRKEKPTAASDDDYTKFAKNFGAGLAIKGLGGMPLFGFFYLVTTPLIALSGQIYLLSAILIFLLFVIFVFVYRAILSPRPRFGAPSFFLFVVAFLLIAVMDQMTLVNASKEHSVALVTEWEEHEAQIKLEREAESAASIVIDVARGEEIFQTVCMTCHRMDERLVGPSLNSVLPGYGGNVDDLASFILKPSKKNPDFPPMPAPGLSLSDAKSVAGYLLQQTDAETTPEKGIETPY